MRGVDIVLMGLPGVVSMSSMMVESVYSQDLTRSPAVTRLAVRHEARDHAKTHDRITPRVRSTTGKPRGNGEFVVM